MGSIDWTGTHVPMSSNSTSRYIPTEMQAFVHQETCTRTFRAALSITVPNWKQLKCPSTMQCMDDLWDVHKNEWTTNKHMEEPRTTLSKRNQTQHKTYYMIPFMSRAKRNKINITEWHKTRKLKKSKDLLLSKLDWCSYLGKEGDSYQEGAHNRKAGWGTSGVPAM